MFRLGPQKRGRSCCPLPRLATLQGDRGRGFFVSWEQREGKILTTATLRNAAFLLHPSGKWCVWAANHIAFVNCRMWEIRIKSWNTEEPLDVQKALFKWVFGAKFSTPLKALIWGIWYWEETGFQCRASSPLVMPISGRRCGSHLNSKLT